MEQLKKKIAQLRLEADNARGDAEEAQAQRKEVEEKAEAVSPDTPGESV